MHTSRQGWQCHVNNQRHNVGRSVLKFRIKSVGPIHSWLPAESITRPNTIYRSCHLRCHSMLIDKEAPPAHSTVDRSAFKEELKVPALRVPKQLCSDLMRQLRGHTFDKPRLKCVLHDSQGDADKRLLLLNEDLDTNDLPELVKQVLEGGNAELASSTVTLDYSHFSAEQVLKKLLPPGVEGPASFETVGHIIHLNLREEQLPYKHIIGQVLLDKNVHVKTVVNKVGSIENEFRVFNMELLAGEPNTVTEVIQHGIRFKLDFAQVYWNSRLEGEHSRLVNTYFKPGNVVADIMAGIGPFAIPAAKQGCKVYANDLNPNSVRFMALNTKLNKVGNNMHIFNLDGRAFVRLLCTTPGYDITEAVKASEGSKSEQQPTTQQDAEPSGTQTQPATQAQNSNVQDGIQDTTTDKTTPTQGSGSSTQVNSQQSSSKGGNRGKGAKGGKERKEELPEVPPIPSGFSSPPGGVLFQHAVMNLPASAVEFLDAFKGAFDPAVWRGKLPLIHVYTFKTAVQTEADVIARIEGFLGGSLDEKPIIHNVRDVAPNKLMLCITFRVPENVAYHGRESAADEPDSKRQRVDS